MDGCPWLVLSFMWLGFLLALARFHGWWWERYCQVRPNWFAMWTVSKNYDLWINQSNFILCFPANVRGSAASLTTAFNWTCTFIVTKTFADIILTLGNHGAFWMFGSICLVGLFFVKFFVPETRGKTLEDIEKKFASPQKGRRRMSSVANLRPTPLSV